jgi:hypothetical protein
MQEDLEYNSGYLMEFDPDFDPDFEVDEDLEVDDHPEATYQFDQEIS